MRSRSIVRTLCLAAAALGLAATPAIGATADPPAERIPTRTPIKHLVVIFQENRAYDHYFGTYPRARNLPGETPFRARTNTPQANGLAGAVTRFNLSAFRPFRLPPGQAATCDRDHEQNALQQAFNHGLMDNFPFATYESTTIEAPGCVPALGMGHYDGNTVTALWHYAQRYSMSDSFYTSVIGPSTPGHLNLVAGDTGPATVESLVDGDEILVADNTVVADPDPANDLCSSEPTVTLAGRNIGDLLNARNVTWGYFQGGFKPTSRNPDGTPNCDSVHQTPQGPFRKDYIPHHQPFQYWPQTSNPLHLPPTSVAAIGRTDRANHQYDITDFYKAVSANNLPAVSFLKAPAYQDEHAGYSSPLAAQPFVVQNVNRIMRSPAWESTAILIAYDDPGGWYDHVMPPILESSQIPEIDVLSGPGQCGPAPPRFGRSGRCGPGQRLPFIAISPYSKENHVDHAFTEQASITRFIEDNWRLGRIGGGSFDVRAGSILGMFDFTSSNKADPAPRVFLRPSNGTVRTVVEADSPQ